MKTNFHKKNFALKAWPNARNISTQHLATLLHDVVTCVERGGQTHTTFSSFFNATCQCLCAPGPWRERSGPNAHALTQQCCVNVAKRVQGLAKRSQHFNATSCNIVGHNMLRTFGHPVAICCVRLASPFNTCRNIMQQGCKMLR